MESLALKQEMPAKLVKSAIRTVALFATFAEAGRPLSLGEVAARLKAPKSSCYELLQTLIHLGYIHAIDEGRSYYPSRRLYEVAEQINRFNPIKERIQNELKALRNLLGETVFICRLQGTKVVYMEVYEGTHAIRYTAQVGNLKPVHASAAGKALLDSLDEEGRDKLFAEMSLARHSDNTITERQALETNLAQCREKGIYTTCGEDLPDVMDMAYPVRVRGRLLAIGLAGPMQRMESHFDSYREALMDTMKRIQTEDFVAPTVPVI